MIEPQEAIAELEEEIQQAKTLRRALRSTPETYFIAQAIGRHLFFTEETGAALVNALREEFVFGTYPLLRSLLESVMEVLLLVSWPREGGPSGAAARSMAWDLLQWEQRWGERKKVRALAPDALPGEQGEEPEDVEASFERHMQEVEERGGDPSLFEKAWAEFREEYPYHWSGIQSFEGRARFAREHFADVAGGQHVTDERVQALTYRAVFFWKEGSYSAHASPRWSLLGLQVEDDGSLQPWVHEGRGRPDQVTSQATSGAEFVGNVVSLAALAPLHVEPDAL